MFRHFELKDLNGDYRLDLVWLTSDGQIKYKLHDNKAFENFESLQGTKWLLTFTSTGKNQWLTFENNGGLVETENNRQWNIVRYDVTDNGLHTFCTAYSSGLNGTDCYYKYTIESFEITNSPVHMLNQTNLGLQFKY